MMRCTQLLTFLCLLPSAVVAQQPHNAEVTIVHRGVSSLKADISSMLKLATSEEQLQEEAFQELVSLFEGGIDPDRPLRFDVLTGFTTPRYVFQVGYTNPEQDILDNIDVAFGATKKVDNNLYELLDPEFGWLRLLPDSKTAFLILTDKNDHDLMRQYILKLQDQLPEAAEMLKGNANTAARIRNRTTSEEDQQKRRDGFEEARELQLDTFQKRPTETQTEFALRKGVAANQLLEIERLLAEAAVAGTVIGFDPETSKSTITFEASAIPETSFDKTLREFGQSPDQFASIEKPDNSVFSLRFNHPIDQLRQDNAIRTLQLVQDDALHRLETSESISDETRTAAVQLIKGFLDVARDSISVGLLNGFWEKLPSDKGDFLGYGAITVKDGQRLLDILKKANETGEGNSIKTSIATVGDVQIHEVKFNKGFFKMFDVIFNGEVGYVGTSKNHLWVATGGESGLDALKEAIGALKEPEENDVILTMEGNLLPFAQQMTRVVENMAPPENAALATARRERLQLLTIASEALQTEDRASFRMDVSEGKASGIIHFDLGTLRLVGRLMATYSKNNL